MRTDDEQNRRKPQCKAGSKLVAHLTYSHLQKLQEPTVEASALIIPSEEVRKVENLTFPTLTDSAVLSDEVKRESTNQGRFAFSLIQSSFPKLF